MSSSLKGKEWISGCERASGCRDGLRQIHERGRRPAGDQPQRVADGRVERRAGVDDSRRRGRGRIVGGGLGGSAGERSGLDGSGRGVAVCAPLFLIGALAGAGGVGLAAKTAADNTGAALGATGSLTERQRRLTQENDPSLVELLASRAAASVGSKLARWRQSKAPMDDSAPGPQTPRV